MNILIDRGINSDSFKELLEATNKDDEHINIYLEGEGGTVHILNMFLHLINATPERFTIIAAGHNLSCNFNLILYSKCEKVIMPFTIGGFHLSSSTVDISSNHTPTYESGQVMMRFNKEILRPKELEQAKQLGLTKAQMKRVEESFMIYFLADEIKELLKQEWNY